MSALPWIFGLAAAALCGLALVLWLTQRRARGDGALPTEWPLSARAVFSSDERRVFRHLRQALPEHLVLAKLPLVRFCQPVGSAEARRWYRLLGSAQVGFAVCSPQGRVLLAADLDNRRTLSVRAERALEIKRRALAACDIPYERWVPGQLPSLADLQDRVPASTFGPSRSGDEEASASKPGGRTAAIGQAAVAPTLWRDSGYFKNSLYDADLSAFGHHALGRAEARGNPDDIVGIVVDHTPEPVVRH
jgi:hypothetical protein